MRRVLSRWGLSCVMAGLACSSGVAESDARRLVEAPSPSPPSNVAKPKAQSHELIGSTLPDWSVANWANSAPLDLADLRGKIVVVRFWTDTCPFCRASMPALQGLADELKDEEVVFVGLYHAKPRGRRDAWEPAVQTAKSWGIRFALGHDEGWQTLRSWWLTGKEPKATSATIVLGPEGKVMHVHPGPVLFPSADPAKAKQNRDYEALRSAIRERLGQMRAGANSKSMGEGSGGEAAAGSLAPEVDGR